MWSAIKEEITALFFPRASKCPVCNRESGPTVCPSCQEKVALLTKEDFCRKCGKLLGKNCEHLLCRDCLVHTHNFVFARGVGPYEGLIREMLWRLKYDGHRSLASFMGRFMAVTLAGEKRLPEIGLIAPVPLSPSKLTRRRFNQSELLSRHISVELGFRAEPHLLARVVDTPAQSKKDRRARLANMKGAFCLNNPAAVKSQRVVLVDDVLTTGATANECSRLLMEAGAAGVYVITWATGRETV